MQGSKAVAPWPLLGKVQRNEDKAATEEALMSCHSF
jgi:hypothetical protein